MTQNLVHNARQHCQAPILSQFENSIVSQQEGHNNGQDPWQNYALNPQTHLQLQKPYLQNQQVPLTPI